MKSLKNIQRQSMNSFNLIEIKDKFIHIAIAYHLRLS